MNPVRATPTNSCDTIGLAKEEVFTLADVAAAMQRIKSGKAAGENKIRSEVLKALNGGVRLMTSVCQVA